MGHFFVKSNLTFVATRVDGRTDTVCTACRQQQPFYVYRPTSQSFASEGRKKRASPPPFLPPSLFHGGKKVKISPATLLLFGNELSETGGMRGRGDDMSDCCVIETDFMVQARGLSHSLSDTDKHIAAQSAFYLLQHRRQV